MKVVETLEGRSTDMDFPAGASASGTVEERRFSAA
jgi:hypothetical protein